MKTAKALSPEDKLVFSVGELAEVLGIGLPAARKRWLGNRANNRDWNRVIFVGEK